MKGLVLHFHEETSSAFLIYRFIQLMYICTNKLAQSDVLHRDYRSA